MKILYLSLIYPKDKNDSNLYKDLAKQFRDEKHEVTIVTLNEKHEKNIIEDEFKIEEGMKVLRVGCGNYFNISNKEKIRTALTLPLKLKKSIFKNLKSEKYDLIMYPSFPINFRLEYLVKELKRKYGAKTYYIHRDHFPYNALNLEMMKKGIIFNYFKWEEKKLLEISDFIGCMSEENKKFVLKNNRIFELDRKIHLLKNWGENLITKNIREESKTNIREELGYDKNDFILVFGGNMGKPQGLEMLQEVIKKLEYEPQIKFLFIGRGTEKDSFYKMSKTNKNIKVLDYIPREKYLDILKNCDMGIVMLTKKFTVPNFPSKTTEYLKIGLPILAAIDNTTDYGKVLKNQMKAGDFVLHGNIEEYCKKILYYKNNLKELLIYSENGKKYYLENLQVKYASQIIIEEINK